MLGSNAKINPSFFAENSFPHCQKCRFCIQTTQINLSKNVVCWSCCYTDFLVFILPLVPNRYANITNNSFISNTITTRIQFLNPWHIDHAGKDDKFMLNLKLEVVIMTLYPHIWLHTKNQMYTLFVYWYNAYQRLGAVEF